MKAFLETNGSNCVPAAKSNFEIFNIVNLVFELHVHDNVVVYQTESVELARV